MNITHICEYRVLLSQSPKGAASIFSNYTRYSAICDVVRSIGTFEMKCFSCTLHDWGSRFRCCFVVDWCEKIAGILRLYRQFDRWPLMPALTTTSRDDWRGLGDDDARRQWRHVTRWPRLTDRRVCRVRAAEWEGGGVSPFIGPIKFEHKMLKLHPPSGPWWF